MNEIAELCPNGLIVITLYPDRDYLRAHAVHCAQCAEYQRLMDEEKVQEVMEA